MKLEYCHAPLKNFGDDLNPWMWPKLIPDLLEAYPDTVFVGIGTLISEKRVNKILADAKEIVVFSSGAWMTKDLKLDDRWKFYAVRGPSTAKELGLDPALGIADGAYLLRTMELPEPAEMPEVCFMPHHNSEDLFDWQSLCADAGIGFISPRQDVEDILAQMRGCKYLITEAMHGAIVADALRLPWYPVSFSPKFTPAKWHDFAAALKMDLTIEPLPFVMDKEIAAGKNLENTIKRGLSRLGIGPDKWGGLPTNADGKRGDARARLVARLQELAQQRPAQLSDDAECERVTQALQDALARIREDYPINAG